MTTRERFHKLMNADPSLDESPVIEWASWWDQTIRQWESEGMPKGMSGEELFDYFGLDSHIQFWFPIYRENCPKPEGLYNTGVGLVTDEADYERLKPYLFPDDAVEQVKRRIEAALPKYESGESLVWYTLDGFFWFPRELFGQENHLYAFYDYPELYHRICDDLAEWQIKIIHEFGKYIKADFMTFAEDMSYNLGPMISKDMFDEFMKPYYEKVIPEIKKYGTRVFIDSDGKVDSAVHWFLDAGIEGVLPLERQSGVDINELQRKHPKLLMIGGFDKTCFFRGRDAVKAEVERLMPAIRNGRYLISMDHQTPPGASMEDYRYYISLLRDAAKQACKAKE